MCRSLEPLKNNSNSKSLAGNPRIARQATYATATATPYPDMAWRSPFFLRIQHEESPKTHQKGDYLLKRRA